MCQWMSAIITRSGKVYFNPWTDSHEDLITLHNLREGPAAQNFVRVEYLPKDGNVADLASYSLRVDERFVPDWFAEYRTIVIEKLARLVAGMIVNDKRKLLLGGVYIVVDQANILYARDCRIISVTGSAHIGEVYGSARIDRVYGSAHIGHVYGSAHIGHVYDSAHIDYVLDSARIDYVLDSARINQVADSARIDHVADSAHIENDLRAK